jgi:hypothetical protein
MFQPVKINGRYKLDGGIKDHAGYHGAPRNERILHHDLKRKPSAAQINQQAQYDNLQRLHLSNLPAVDPFRLHHGMVAYKMAYEQTKAALSRPITPRLVT